MAPLTVSPGTDRSRGCDIHIFRPRHRPRTMADTPLSTAQQKSALDAVRGYSEGVLGPGDPIPPAARRFVVAGASGSGKTTLSQTIANAFDLPTVQLDQLYHGSNWVARPSFVADVDSFTSTPAWVVEWQYTAVQPMLLDRCDVLIWLDHTRATVMRRVIARTLRRRLHRQQLWNGNYEPPLRTLLTDRDHIIRWAWRTYPQRRAAVLSAAGRADSPTIVRLRGQSDVDVWLRQQCGGHTAERHADRHGQR